MNEEKKRVFFGVEVDAPWPEPLPRGHKIQEECRHLTLAFLGNIPWQPLQEMLSNFPKTEIKIGDCGYFDAPLFLPKGTPHAVAWHVEGLGEELYTIQRQIVSWLKHAQYSVDDRPFLPHVTIARTPFSLVSWRNSFKKLPIITGSIHLYENLGELNYSPIWSYPLLPPFQQIEHTADLAYVVRGHNLMQIEKHALAALAFAAPALTDKVHDLYPKESFEDVIISLNKVISASDALEDIGITAVRFHGDLEQKDFGMQWEMIVDV